MASSCRRPGLAQQADPARAEPGRVLLDELSAALVEERQGVVQSSGSVQQADDV
ncbi:hypothetical protein ABS735_18895 [Streptomyces sp. MMCC 100]|uniref:hypothetical protein n=1 Tax=Streptomyces sp. MMCC 100 TaxID=3163555 RepID=UPI003596C430